MAELKALVEQTIKEGRGVVFASPAIVHRPTYSGRDILAPNSEFTPDKTDDRGYVPVEWLVCQHAFPYSRVYLASSAS